MEIQKRMGSRTKPSVSPDIVAARTWREGTGLMKGFLRKKYIEATPSLGGSFWDPTEMSAFPLPSTVGRGFQTHLTPPNK